jgi:hypothetical protein
MGTYSYVTLVVSFNATEVGGDEPWMFLYDWVDADPHDGMPNLYNATTNTGNELRRLTNAGDASNVNELSYATVPTSNLDALLVGNMTLVIHDPIHDVNMTAPGHDFTCTVIFWETAVDSTIAFADNGVDASTSVNITLTVPSDAETGIHTGFVSLTHSADTIKIPYGYNVVANLTGAAGTTHTIVDGWGAELSPYDNAAYGCMEEDPDDWDFRSYAIYNQHPTAKYLGIRVIWDDTGNDMFVQAWNSILDDVGYGSALTDTTTAVIVELDGVGMTYLEIHPLALNATVSGPVNFTIEAIWYESLTDLPHILSATYDDRADVEAVVDGDSLVGDHVELNATYPEFNLPGMPEFEITSMKMSFLSGLLVTRTGDVAEPSSENWPLVLSVTSSYVVEVVDGIKAGDVVTATLSMGPGADPALLIYEWVDGAIGTQITVIDDYGGGGDESGQFTADADMSIACVIYSFFYTAAFPDEYELIIDSRVSVDKNAVGSQVQYDTYDLAKNGTFAVYVRGFTDTNIDFLTVYSNITFSNYFKPHLANLTVDDTTAIVDIDWDVFDLNAGDTHTYEVLLSSDSGVSFQLLIAGITDTDYQWDSTGFLVRNYLIQVRVTDSYGLTDSVQSAAFEAGTVPITTGPTTPTTPTTPTGTGWPIDPLWIGLIGGIGVGVVVVLILFLVKKK